MDVATVNQFLFPVVLFILVFSSFYIDTDLFASNSTSNKSVVVSRHGASELEQFFNKVSQDSILTSKLESIIEEKNFMEQIVILGNSLGYTFTIKDVRQSIAEHTANPDGSYICLPLGCWRIG